MLSTFGSTYFGNQYQLDTASSRDLNEVVDSSSTSVEIFNASYDDVSAPVTVPLEDGTFQITWPGQTALTSVSELTGSPLTVPASSSVVVTLTFLKPGRDSVQTVDLGWAGTLLTLTFKRFLRVTDVPQGDITDEFEYKTNVSEAWDGSEQRTRLRANPRLTTKYKYIVGASDRSTGHDFQAQMMGLTSREAKVSLWHRTQPVVVEAVPGGGFADDAWFLALDGPAFWDPSIATMKTGDVLNYEDAQGTQYNLPLKTDATSSARLFFGTSIPGASVGDQFTAIPQSPALLRETPKVSVYPSDAVAYESTWISQQGDYTENLLDSSTLYSSLATETFNSRPILREGGLVQTNLSFSGDSGAIEFDKKIGVIGTFQRRESSTIAFERSFEYAYEPGKVEALREFIMWTQGRQRSFYVPSGTEDFFATDNNANVLTVMGTGLGGLTPLLDGYASFEVTSSGVKTQYTVISSIAKTDGTVDITYDGVLGDPAGKRFELLYHVRMASDKIKIGYEGRDSVKCKFKVQTVKQ